jgi:hypothetical protein
MFHLTTLVETCSFVGLFSLIYVYYCSMYWTKVYFYFLGEDRWMKLVCICNRIDNFHFTNWCTVWKLFMCCRIFVVLPTFWSVYGAYLVDVLSCVSSFMQNIYIYISTYSHVEFLVWHWSLFVRHCRCMESVEALVVRVTVLVLNCAAQYECRMIIDWKEMWWESARYGMVWWAGYGGGYGSYNTKFKIASHILLGRIICLTLSWISAAASLWMSKCFIV